MLIGRNELGTGPLQILLSNWNSYGNVTADAVRVVPLGTPSAPTLGQARWAAPEGASYQVYARWPASSTQSKNAFYTVTHAGGTTETARNQQTGGGQWNLLGTFTFSNPDTQGVALSADPDLAVAADAIRFVPTGASTTVSTLAYVHTDHLNTPLKLTDSSQQIVWDANYEPFGKTTLTAQPYFDNPLRFPGQYYDPETGLLQNWNRDYDPALGRYVQFDPIGLAGGINGYIYGYANPINFFDPDGRRVYWNGHPLPNQGVIDIVERIDECNGNRDVYVTSTVRDEKSNKAAGGKPRSRHLTGNAVDFYVPGQSSEETAAQAVGAGAMGVSTYDKNRGGHTHVDNRTNEWNGHNSKTQQKRPPWREKPSKCECSK